MTHPESGTGLTGPGLRILSRRTYRLTRQTLSRPRRLSVTPHGNGRTIRCG
jgi:hypothetical protein